MRPCWRSRLGLTWALPVPRLASYPPRPRLGVGIVLDDEVVPVGDPHISVRTDLGHYGREPFVCAGHETKGVYGLVARFLWSHVVHAQQVAGRAADECPPISPRFRETGGSGEGVSTTCGVGIERVDLTNVRGNRMELGRTCDHLGAHATLTAKDSVGDAPEEAGIVVGGGAEYVAGFVESNAPCVVVELVKEFHVRAIGTKAKGSRSEIVLFAVYLAVETRVTDGAVNPVVKTVAQVAWACVRVPYAESGEENFAVIGFVVAIGILKEEKFRSMGENDAATGKNHRGGYVESVGKYGEFVCFAIAVGIFANLYSIITFAPGFNSLG